MYLMEPVHAVSAAAHKVAVAAAESDEPDLVCLRAQKVIRDAIEDLEAALEALGVNEVKLSPETEAAIAQHVDNDPDVQRRRREAFDRRN